MSVAYTSGPEQLGPVPSSHPAQAAPPRNGLATASLVLGIVSLVTSLLFVPAILGVVLGVAGLRRARRTTPSVGAGKAVAGIVLSTLGLLVGMGIVAALTGDGDADAGPGDTRPVVQQDAGSATSGGDDGAQEPAQEPARAGIGDPVRDGKFEFTVDSIETGVSEVGDEYLGMQAQGQFVLVHLTVENIGDEAQYLDGNNVTAYDGQGREFDADTEAAIYLDGSNSFLNDINPGNVVEGVVIFDVPADVDLHRLELHDSLFSGGVSVVLM